MTQTIIHAYVQMARGMGLASMKKAFITKIYPAYTLVEMSLSMTIIAIMVAIGLGTIGKESLDDKYRITNVKIRVVERAIMDFYKANGFIPCPAPAPQLENSADFGISPPGSYDAATGECLGIVPNLLVNNTGMIPVRTLGIPDEFAYDAWHRVMSYRIARNFGSEVDFNDTENLGDLKIVDLLGNEITNMSGSTQNNFGAAYVIISHGYNGDTYTWGRNTLNIPTPNTTAIEFENFNTNKIYIQNVRTTEFDDITAFKTKMAFINLKKGISPVAFSKLTCSNANILKNLTSLPAAPAFFQQIPLSAAAVSNMCASPPQLNRFRPTDPGNLVIWWDGSDPANTGAAPANGTLVSAVQNKANTAGPSLSQVSAPATPEYRNNLPQIPRNGTLGALNFRRTSPPIFGLRNSYSTNLNTAINNSPYTLFFAGKILQNSLIFGSNNSCGTNNTINLFYGSISGDSNNFLTLSHGNNDAGIYIEQYDAIDVPVIIMARYCHNCTGTNVSLQGIKLLFINKNGLVLSNEGMTNLANNFPVYSNVNFTCGTATAAMNLSSSATGNWPLGGAMGEMLVYDKALNNIEVSEVIEYLSNRWFAGSR